MFKLVIALFALVACATAAPGLVAAYTAPVAAAPIVTASSSQVFARNYNGFAAPLAVAAPLAAAYTAPVAAVAAPYAAAPYAAAPYAAAPYAAAPYAAAPYVAAAPYAAAAPYVAAAPSVFVR